MYFARFMSFMILSILLVGCPQAPVQPVDKPEEEAVLALSIQEKTDYESAMKGEIADCANFVKQYPSSIVSEEVINRYVELLKSGTADNCVEFLELLPKDSHVAEVKKLFAQKKEEEDFDIINSQKPKEDLEYLDAVAELCKKFIKNFPQSKHLNAVKDKYIEFIKSGPSSLGVGFLKEFPEDDRAEEVTTAVKSKFEEELFNVLQKGEITIAQCTYYLKEYPEGKYYKEVADELFKKAQSGSMEACDEFLKFLQKDVRVVDVRKIKSELEYEETLAVFYKFITSKILKWKLELKSGEFIIKQGIYQILETIIIAENAKLIIQPGTSLNFADNTGIICKGILIAEGLAENKIIFSAIKDNVWNNVSFIGKKSSESVLKYAAISGGKGISTKNAGISANFALENEYVLGGGILCVNEASPTFESCEIKNNVKPEGLTVLGGGICCWSASSPTINNCKIMANSAVWGGGLYIYEKSTPILIDCIISQNTATSYAGGVVIFNSNAKFTKTVITKNVCSNPAEMKGGGGVYCIGTDAEFTKCEITENRANSGAGVYLAQNSSPKFVETKINSNSATYRGGGILCTNANAPMFTNCEIAKNIAGAKEFGGGVDCFDNKSNPNVKEENGNIVKDNVPRNFYYE